MKNFEMFIYLYLKGLVFKQDFIDITFINKRYNLKTQELTILEHKKINMKKALVLGGGGFVRTTLQKDLKRKFLSKSCRH